MIVRALFAGGAIFAIATVLTFRMDRLLPADQIVWARLSFGSLAAGLLLLATQAVLKRR